MFSKHTQLIAGIGTLFFVGCVTSLVVFVYAIEDKKNELLEKSQEEAKQEFHRKSLTTLTEALNTSKDEREFLLARILKEEDVIEFLTLVETIGKEQGVSLTTNSLTVQPINNSFETLVVNVSVEGVYPAIMHTLKLFEHLPYQVTLTTVRLEKINEGTEGVWRSLYEIRVTKFKKV